MTQADSSTKISIDITQADSDEQLVMMVAIGSKCDVHHISLSQARALSLELIKQAYRAELRSSLSKPKPTQSASYQFRHRHQT